jgi:hypothetical protein
MGCHDANTLAVYPARWGFCAAILRLCQSTLEKSFSPLGRDGGPNAFTLLSIRLASAHVREGPGPRERHLDDEAALASVVEIPHFAAG